MIAQTRLMKTSKQRVTKWACILMNVSEIINRASSSSSLAVTLTHALPAVSLCPCSYFFRSELCRPEVPVVFMTHIDAADPPTL